MPAEPNGLNQWVNDVAYTLERLDGVTLTAVPWDDDAKAVDFLIRLAEAVQINGFYPGDDAFDPTSCFVGLQKVIEYSYEQSLRPDPVLRVIQLCPPQWVVSKDLLATMGDDGRYAISMEDLDRQNWRAHMLEKDWVDRDSFELALEVAQHLAERQKRDRQSRAFIDEPPF